MVCEAPALEEGEEAALAAVAQQARHQAAGARAVVGGVVRQREGEVEVVTLDSTVQYSTVQYSTVQYSTVQYSTVQYSTGPLRGARLRAVTHLQSSASSLCQQTVRFST